jgi:outer membrane protein assembly factor BamE
MLDSHRRQIFGGAIALAGTLMLGGCGSFDGASHKLAEAITPYRIEVVQGNFVSKEQVAELHKGMTKLQVRETLGTSLLTSIFRADRWDYVFTIRRPGVKSQERRLTVFFKDGVLDHFEGDEMPTEAEFVASLDTGAKGRGKVPTLQASEDSLKRFTEKSPPSSSDAASASSSALPPLPTSYPPLESSSGTGVR